MFRSYCLCIALSLAFAACSSKRVMLDPVTVKVNSPKANIYRGAYTRTIDIIHTRLDLKINFDSANISGKASLDLRPYFYPSNKVVLNALGFKINKVQLLLKDQSQSLNYEYDGKLLTISLDKTYTHDQKFTLFIDYLAQPSLLKVGDNILSSGGRGFYFVNPKGLNDGKPRQFWTQGEPESNCSWFPTINDPQEKMTQEISITVPSKMVTLSNGELDFSIDNGDGTKTDTWRLDKPHASYLTMVAGGDFVVTKDKWDDKEVSYYTDPAFAQYARLVFGKTPEMISFFSKKLDYPFPWPKYSQVVVHDFNDGAMENTTATVLFEGMNMNEGQYKDENYESIISHELFHHWFGNLVTAESWANLPLNESFATYGEYLWNEYKYGKDMADMYAWKDLQVYLSSDKDDLDVIRFNYADPDQMFDQISYQKGSLILNMLRKTVGDEAFFKALNLYLRRFEFKTAEIHDLRIVFEEVTGSDLNWFFNQWFLAAGHPVLDIENNYDLNNNLLSVHIRQKQNVGKFPYFQLPLTIDVYQQDKVTHYPVVMNKADQTFTFNVGTKPDLVNVDAEKYLLCEKQEKKTMAEYSFQYQYAPLFLDRWEAVQFAKSHLLEQAAKDLIIKALNDKNWQIRMTAVFTVPDLPESDKERALLWLKDMALHDSKSLVRAAAINTLAANYKDKDLKEIYQKATNDNAPSVQKALSNAIQ